MKKLSFILGLLLISILFLFAESQNLLKISGLIEIDYSLAKVNDGTTSSKESNFILSTAQLNLEKEFNKKIKSSLVFLYEEGEDNDQIKIDEAKLDININEKTNFIVGKRLLPFGVFETYLISDPLTMNIGEIKKVSAGINYKISDGLIGGLTIFKGPKETAEKNNVAKDVVLNLGYENEAIALNVGYITNMLAIKDLPNEIGVDINNDIINKRGNGLAGSLKLNLEKITFIAEGIKNKGDIKVNNLDYAVKSYNLEIGYNKNEKCSFGIRYELLKTETLNSERNIKNYGLCINKEVYENTNLSFEYLKNKETATGANEIKNDIFTLELSYQF